MNAIVIYKSRYGATRSYAEWIAEELHCDAVDAKAIRVDELSEYDTIIYGGGLYAQTINGVSLITKNIDRLKDKKIAVYSTGITPLECRDYYDKIIIEKNFKPDMMERIRVFNFPGKMVVDELSLVHKTLIKGLKKMIKDKENPTEMEKLLIELCDTDGDFLNREDIYPLVRYVVGEQIYEKSDTQVKQNKKGRDDTF